MKKPYFLALILGIVTCFTAQSQSSQGRIKGIVIDATTHEALPFTSVAILHRLNEQNNLIGGAQTTLEGSFEITNLPSGNFILQISYVGYQTLEQPVILENNQTLDLKTIFLQQDAKVLKEIKVVGEKSQIQISAGKQIFNVDKNLTTIGGTAESVLRNVPSITIDETGSASLRNMSTTIYVNGRPTQLTLAQIPANQISSIEVISNPSARYDASTSGGIINLVLKKNKEQGYNGLVTAGVGNNSRYDATLNLDWQKKKWNLTTLYSFNSTRNPLNGYANRINKNADGSPQNYFNQNTSVGQNNLFHSGRISADYTLNNNNVFTLATTLVTGAFNTSSYQEYSYQDLNYNVVSYGTRSTIPYNNYVNTGFEFDWKHQFPEKGREVQFTTSVTRNRVSNAGDWYTSAYDVDNGGTSVSKDGYPVTNRIDGRIIGNQILAQLDYVHPVNESSKWEVGLRSFSYLRDQQYLFNEVHDSNKILLQDYSQNAQINETVNAIYALYDKKMNSKLNLQGGLRLEQSFLHGLSHFDGTKFGYDYPSKEGQNLFQSFFPSFSMNKKINETSQWNFSLSRKVGRPNFRHVFVGIQANDKQNITIGNPKVRPEFVNTAEVSYDKTWTNAMGNSLQWLSSGYYIYEDHTIKPVTQPYASDSSILVTTFQNVKADIQYGIDNTLNYSSGRLSVVANFNGFESIIQSVDVTTKMLRYNAKLNITYKFGAGISAQISGQRRSKSPQLQGYQRAVTGVDFALRKGFWQNRASVTFIINDIFNSRKFITVYDQPLAYQVSMNRREIRFYKLTLQFPLSRGSNKMKERKLANPDIDFGN